MKRLFLQKACIGLCAILAGAAESQPLRIADYCGSTDDVLDLQVALGGTDTRSVKHHEGVVVTGGMVMPHPADSGMQTGRFETRGNQFYLVAEGGGGVEVPLTWTLVGKAAPTDDIPPEAELLVGPLPDSCDKPDYPTLIGETSVTVNGTVLTFDLRLILATIDRIEGLQQVRATVNGMPFLERRTFSMTRN